MSTDIILEQNGVVAQFITQPTSWHVFAANRLVADIHKEDWANDDIDFDTREAGQLLLTTIAELKIAFDSPTEADMVKDDQGATVDVPDTSGAEGVSGMGCDPGSNGPDATIDAGALSLSEVMQLFADILSEAEERQNGPSPEHIAALAELETIIRRLEG